MTPICPRCRSSQLAARNHARKADGTIGAIAGAAGCSAGITLGELNNDKVLDNYRCLDCDCGYTFGRSSANSSPYPTAYTASEEYWFTASDTDEPLHERHF